MPASGDPALSICFNVKIDQHDLGAFSSCEGLALEVKVEQREEGGNNGFVHQLVTGVKFPNIKLTRPLSEDTQKVTSWFASMTRGVKRSPASITALTLDGKKIVTWNLHEVIPVRWTGPNFSLDSAKAATETLEIAHHGFLPGE